MKGLVWILLCAELVDELHDGVVTSAWPAICGDLALTYVEVGLLLGVPIVIGNAVEPLIGLASDVWGRRKLAVIGGVCLALAMAIGALSYSFGALLVAFSLFYPSSGAFVGLAELDLIEQEGASQTRWMMVWMAVGSLGALLGPLLLLLVVWAGGSWRLCMGLLALFAAILTFALWRSPVPAESSDDDEDEDAQKPPTLAQAARDMWRATQDRQVQKSIGLLMMSDLMLEVMCSFLALWMVDHLGRSQTVGALSVTTYIGAMLVGSTLLSRLMRDAHSFALLRWTALAALPVLWLFIESTALWWSFGLLVALGLLVSGWYPILKAAYYASFPGKSGVAMAVHSLSSSISGMQPLLVGWIADRWGLPTALYVLSLGCVVILVSATRRPLQ